MKRTTRLLSTLLVGTFLSFGLQPSVQAAATLSYTNTADAWLTPASWSPANDWTSGAVQTNATTANAMLMRAQGLANDAAAFNISAKNPELTRILQSVQPKTATGD